VSCAFVSTRRKEKVKNEVSVIVGYPQKPGHDASAAIGSATYAMYTQNDGAWVKKAAEEAQMVDAMRKGANMVVKSESGRGTKTTDTYSMKGIAQALDRVAEEWQGDPVKVFGTPRQSGKTSRSSLDRLRFAIVIAGKAGS